MTSARSRLASSGGHLDVVICLDRSGSMGYGHEQSKLSEAKRLTMELARELLPDDRVGVVSFDSIAGVAVPLTLVSELRNLEASIAKISERGNTCLAEGVKAAAEAFDLKAANTKRLIMLSDGRANLSLDGSGGFEGSTSLERELRETCIPLKLMGICVVAATLGTDAFTMPLKALTDATRGNLILDGRENAARLVEALRSEAMSLTVSIKPPTLERRGLEVAGFPSELPAGQPTWTLESVNEHVAIVSEEAAAKYASAASAVVSNPANQRFAKVALLSIESEALKSYRERLPKTTAKIRSGETILLDKSYRSELELEKEDVVDLKI